MKYLNSLKTLMMLVMSACFVTSTASYTQAAEPATSSAYKTLGNQESPKDIVALPQSTFSAAQLDFETIRKQMLESARGGVGNTGGGDAFAVDFIFIAHNIIYPWLKANGSKLKPAINAEDFHKKIEPKKIAAVDLVFESCDGSKNGREVEACYDSLSGGIFINRTRYKIDYFGAAKIGLVAHEIFRKMGLEGDGYEITRQMSITSIPPQSIYWDILTCSLKSTTETSYFVLPGFVISADIVLSDAKDIPALFRFIGAEPVSEGALYSSVQQAPEVGIYAVLTVNADGAIHQYNLARTADKTVTATMDHFDPIDKKTSRSIYVCKPASE